MSLSVPRFGPCAVGMSGVIVVTGGMSSAPAADSPSSSNGTTHLDSAELYDTRTGRGWTPLPRMTRARSRHGCSVLRGDGGGGGDGATTAALLVAGGSGTEEEETSNSVELISLARPSSGWTEMPPMNISRCCLYVQYNRISI